MAGENTKVSRQDNGDKLVIDADGLFEVGGVEFTGAEVAAALALVSSIPVTDPESSGEIWNDEGTLKASAGGG